MKRFIIQLIVLSVCAIIINAEECTEENSGLFINSPYSCRAFYHCSENGPVFGECPEGFYFNVYEQNCDFPENVDCTENFQCPATGIHHFEVKNSCTDYILCVNGQESQRTCPAGLHFDTDIGLCNKPAAANCRRELCAIDSENSAEIIFYPSPDNCYDFYICDDGIANRFTCPEGLHFNFELEDCDFPDNANCHLIPTTTEGTTPIIEDTTITTTTEEYITTTEEPTFDCDPNIELEYFPHDTDCNAFWRCLRGESTLMRCPSDLHFDPIVQNCNTQENAGCAHILKSVSQFFKGMLSS